MPYPAVVLGLASLYFCAAKLGLTMAFAAEQVTAVWPPTGIALAALLLLGGRVWPGIALGVFAADATANEPLATTLGIAAGNTLEGVVAAWALRRSGFLPTLERTRDVLTLVAFAVVPSTAVSATIGVTSLCAGGVQPWERFAALWGVWWVGDAMGDLVVAPLLLVWAAGGRIHWRTSRAVEAAALAVALVAVGLGVFAGWLRLGGYPLHYAIVPLVIWAALRFGQRGTTAVTFVASGFAIWSAVNGRGPFGPTTSDENLVLLQLFMAVVAGPSLLLGAGIAERNRAASDRAVDYAALQVGEERLRLALKAGRMGVWDWNVTTNEAKWSEELEAIHGLAPGTFGGTLEAFQALVHPDDRDYSSQAVARALDGRGFEVELRVVPPDGTLRWVAGSGRVFRDGAGRPIRMLGVAMDVTERRRLEEALRDRAAELADADRRKDEFLAMLAHELRNPLAPMRNALSLMERSTDAAVVAEARGLIERQLQHLVRLVNDLLDVSRITSGKITLHRERVELAAVVAAALETAAPQLGDDAPELTVTLPPEPVWLEADATRLAQVIANLLGNAAKFTPHTGRIRLTAEREGDAVVVRVRDTGIGMSPETRSRAFELFAQGERTLDRVQSGLGVGLTVVRRLVEMHDGSVAAESDGTDLGSCFTVRLPALPPAAGARPAASDRDGKSRPAASPRRILVVDDNVDMAASLAMVLELDGHQVRTAHEGPGALGAARAFGPEVVVLDVGLPGMDGYAVAKALRADPLLARVRLIALSGYGQDVDRQRAREAGFDHHLVKPVDPETLLALLTAPPGSGAPAPGA